MPSKPIRLKPQRSSITQCGNTTWKLLTYQHPPVVFKFMSWRTLRHANAFQMLAYEPVSYTHRIFFFSMVISSGTSGAHTHGFLINNDELTLLLLHVSWKEVRCLGHRPRSVKHGLRKRGSSWRASCRSGSLHLSHAARAQMRRTTVSAAWETQSWNGVGQNDSSEPSALTPSQRWLCTC